MLDEPAEAVGDLGRQRIAEGRRLAFDVVGGAKELFARIADEPGGSHAHAGSIEPIAFGFHSAGELARKRREGGLGAGDGVQIESRIAPGHRHRLAQRVARNDHFVIGEGGDLCSVGAGFRHETRS